MMARRSMEALAGAKLDDRALVAERAYFKSERRGFAPGHEVEDWLAAERELAALSMAPATSSPPANGAAAASAPRKKPATRRKGATVKKLK